MPRLPTREELSDARKQGTINKNDRITQDVRGFVFVDDASGSRLHCEVHIGKSVRVTLLTSISISAFGEEVHVAWFALSFHPHGFQPKVDFVFRKGVQWRPTNGNGLEHSSRMPPWRTNQQHHRNGTVATR